MRKGNSLKFLQSGLDRISGKKSSLEGWSGTGTQGSGGFTLSEVSKNTLETWTSGGLVSAGLSVGLVDLACFFNFNDTVILFI